MENRPVKQISKVAAIYFILYLVYLHFSSVKVFLKQNFFKISIPLFCRKAMLMLRKKKFQESLLQKTDKQLENIERMV